MAAPHLGLVLSAFASFALVNPTPAPGAEIVIGHADDAQPPLPLASDGVLRWLWHSRFGDILIEVMDGEVFVNGQPVSHPP